MCRACCVKTQERAKRFYNSVAKGEIFYSAETLNKLNYLTLQIKDREIKQKYDDLRTQKFRSLCKPISLIAVLNFFTTLTMLNLWSSFFQGE